MASVEAVRRELPCPNSPECDTCKCSEEDDACFPDEAIRALRRRAEEAEHRLEPITAERDEAVEALRALSDAALPFFDKADDFRKIDPDEIMPLGVALHKAGEFLASLEAHDWA